MNVSIFSPNVEPLIGFELMVGVRFITANVEISGAFSSAG